MNKIIHGDCLEKLKDLPDNSVDSIVTDPPYHLVSIVKRFGKENSAPAKFGTDGAFSRASKGFMGKDWDGVNEEGIGIAQKVELWKECLRVLKPGGHLLAFSGTRTYHRMASAIEDAGFEVRDMIEWVYSTGFPKSLNISKAIEKSKGILEQTTSTLFNNPNGKRDLSKRSDYGYKYEPKIEDAKQWEGWGTALKPAHEPICMARKPLAEKTVAENCLKYGTGGINIDESRVGVEKIEINGGGKKWRNNGKEIEYVEPINEERIGRFPANLLHDNSDEVRECFPETKTGKAIRSNSGGKTFGGENIKPAMEDLGYDDSGNASRFFKSIIYQAKASKSERNKGCEDLETKDAGASMNSRCATCGKQKLDHENSRCKCEVHIPAEMKSREGVKNNHPTVKPIALMEYLIKMVTPKGGIVLDPFAGSGSTLVAAKQNGFNYIGIEMTEEYIPIINARLGL